MIDRATGNVKISSAWVKKGDSRASVEGRLGLEEYSLFSTRKTTSWLDDSIQDEFLLMFKDHTANGWLSFKHKTGLEAIKFSLNEIAKDMPFSEQVNKLESFLQNDCEVPPGQYPCGAVSVNKDYRDGTSDIVVSYD